MPRWENHGMMQLSVRRRRTAAGKAAVLCERSFRFSSPPRNFRSGPDLRIFLSYFKPHKKLFVLDMVCALTIALIDLAFPYLSRWCVCELLPQNAYRTCCSDGDGRGFCGAGGVDLYHRLLRAHLWYSGRGGHPPGSVPPHAGTGFQLLLFWWTSA